MARYYRCISGDSHLDIRPERWTPRVPKRWRERAPRTVILANGNEGILVENRSPRSPGATTITGIPYEKALAQALRNSGSGNKIKTASMRRCCFHMVATPNSGAASAMMTLIRP
jgi:hypothetical protein